MATIVTVHGSFAHVAGPASTSAGTPDPVVQEATLQWWQRGSSFEAEMRRLLAADEGELHYEPFAWSGQNSERSRREASEELLAKLVKLDSASERYIVIGHSHGGSVVSGALMRAAARGLTLDGLRKWITIGTPFIELKKERLLFQRLPLVLKAMFIASLMLAFMFGFNVIAEFRSGNLTQGDSQKFALTALLTAAPFLAFYAAALYWDSRRLSFYRPRNRTRAKERFAGKWLALTHEDDEAVRGLGSLRDVRLNLFHATFAVPALSLMSVFILPLTYLWFVYSPPAIISLSNFLRDNVYAVKAPEHIRENYGRSRTRLKNLRREKRRTVRRLSRRNQESDQGLEQKRKVDELNEEIRSAKRRLRDDNAVPQGQPSPGMASLDRELRFRTRFFMRRGVPCPGDVICGRGKDRTVNSRLLYHVVTDEASSLVLDQDLRSSVGGRIFEIALLSILVPVAFGLIAIALMMAVQFAARFVSARASRWLDSLTWSQFKRTALGNDTEAEVAIGAARHPAWVTEGFPFLPAGLADQVTEHSNTAMAASLGKFRDAISELVLTEGDTSRTDRMLAYLSWQELIHTSYFEILEFRELVALAIAETEGFKAIAGPARADVVSKWYASLHPGKTIDVA